MNRERIVLILVVLLLGLLSWRLFSREAPRATMRAASSKELPAATIPGADPVVPLSSAAPPRDVFERPSADQPLPLLSLPSPPLADLPDLLPPPWPDPGPTAWSDHLYARPAALAGAVDEVVDVGGDSGLAEAPAPTGEPQDGDYADTYDALRLNALSGIWGRVLNENRYELKPEDTIVFQQVNPRTGKDQFAPQSFAAGQYESVTLANTLVNRIERESRLWRAQLGPARAIETRDYLRQLLDLGLLETLAFQRAEELALELVRKAADDVENWMMLGEVWERTFALDRAFALYGSLSGETLNGEAAALPPGLPAAPGRFRQHPAPRVRMAAVMRMLGREDLAASLLRQALALDARDPAAAIALGELEVDAGLAVKAAERLATARRNLGSSAGQFVSVSVGLALGRAQLGARAWTEAAKTYEDVIAALALDDPALAAAHGGRVSALYLAGDFATAAEAAQEAVEIVGPHFRLLYLRGIAVAAAGGAAGEVVRDLRAAAAASPLDAAPALAALAFWYERQGLTAEAGDLLQQALDLDPSHAYSRWLAAHRALRDGDVSTAAAGLEALVRETPDCAAALTALGWLLALEGSAQRAEVAYASAEDRAPQSARLPGPASGVWADLVLRRGLNLLALGRRDEARAAFERALNLDPGLTAARNGTAAALYAGGDLAAAVEEFSELQDALRETPEDLQLLHAKRWQAQIESHDKLRQWRDGFDGRRLRPGYDTGTLARLGVTPALENGALAVRGTHREKGETRAFREVPAGAFRAAALDVAAGATHRGDAGAFLALRNRTANDVWSFRVHRDREGNLHWTTVRAGKPAFGRIGVQIPPDQPFHVEFRLDREPAQPVLQVWVDGINVFAEPVQQWKNPTGQAAVGILVETANTLEVNAWLDNLELVYAVQG